MALSEIDRNLLRRCLHHRPRAWEDFVDRFMGLIVHVVDHTAHARSVRLGNDERDDLCAEVFLSIIKNDYGVLRRFRGQSSLATYLTVVARRVVVKQILQRKNTARLGDEAGEQSGNDPQERISDREEVERLASQEAGLRRAEIVSAGALRDDQLERLRRALSTRTGAEVEVSIQVDPSLLGGVIAKVGDLVFDGSLRTQLRQLRANLTR